ncbi:MAG: SBBP repeat-containing protein [Bacteroidia bacterium]|nr:SBBP repeat-containing protein [Bacteroidia bacterium]MBP7260965.1 SBBP repeat-containing protein [Bacteroidia bacterium]MBP9180444.1 SBBP repeat-containing protein [Bacteroidia bacterium]MBP9723591.1 SBBP repeat-containing protein [Bacteroidia bacterium]
MNRTLILLCFFTTGFGHCCSFAQDIAFSNYQNAINTGFYSNNGRLTNQYGESRNDIQVAYQGNNFQAFFTKNGWSYQLKKSLRNNSDTLMAHPALKQATKFSSDSLLISRVQMQWFSSSEVAEFELSEPAGAPLNVYRENFAAENLRAHNKMTWTPALKGIHFEFSCLSETRFKYNVVVAPGADIKSLKCVIKGAERIQVKNNGKTLELLTPCGIIEEEIPQSWQLSDKEVKLPLQVKWSLKGDTAMFELPENYNPALPLVIDPWATYLGGTGGANYDYGEDVATDVSMNVYGTGISTSLFNMATSGTFQTSLAGAEDVYLIRYNSNGTRQWCTYYGGVNTDYAGAVSASGSNILLMAMSTYNTGLATSGTHQSNQQGNIDVLLCRMNTSNGQRIWATYYGGTLDDFAQSVHTDASGNVYVTGYTTSNNGIATSGTFKTSKATTDQDAFVARFNASGSRVWGTYYGGANTEVAFDVTLDVSGNIIIGGYTFSTSNIATTGTHQSFSRGNQEGFVAKLNATGTLLWGTYFGGNQDETVYTLAIDASGRIYAGGYTNSNQFIATTGAFKTSLSGISDGFLFRLNFNGTMNYSTFYGGENDEVIYGIKVDASGNTYFCGYTTSSSGIATSGAYQTTIGGVSDGFTGKFNPSGVRLWCTYYGGPDFEFCRNISLDISSNVIITGYTSSTSGIAKGGAQSTLSGFINAFVAKFNTNGVLPVSWLNVSASAFENYVLVEWSTATETDNDYFTVEHSIDGESFNRLADINGAGNSNTVQTYRYTHKYPGAGTHYYRIRQTDFNGTFDYSPLAVATMHSKTGALVLNGYVKNNQLFLFTNNPDDDIQISALINMSGQDVTAVNSNTPVSISHLPPGIYTAVVSINGISYSYRFIR